MMEFHSREIAASEKCRRYRRNAEIMRRLPKKGTRRKLALLMRRTADWLEPEASLPPQDLERTT